MIWLRCLSINVFLNHNIQINTNFHFSFRFRLRFLSIDFFLNVLIHLLLFLSIFINWCFPQWHLRINTNFHFSFPFRLIFLSIDFFSICKYTYVLHTIFHFYFLVGLRLWSINIFLNLYIQTYMQLYIEEPVDILINSNWPFCQFHFERKLIFLSIIDININKITFCSTKV